MFKKILGLFLSIVLALSLMPVSALAAEAPEEAEAAKTALKEEAEPMRDEINRLEFIQSITPRFGLHPQFSLTPVGSNYRVSSIRWWYANDSDSDLLHPGDVFDDREAEYWAEITLYVDGGSSLSEDAEVYFGGEQLTGCEVFNMHDNIWLIRTPHMSIPYEGELIVIDTIEVTGFVAPVFGADMVFYLYVPEGAHCSIMGGSGMWSSKGFDEEKFTEPGRDASFQEGIHYEYFYVRPDEGYTFADELTITINGDASLVDNYVYESEHEWIKVETIRFYVYDPSDTVIHSIEVTGFVAPVFGADINYYLYVPEGAHYSIMWNSGSWTSSGFGEGKSIEPDRIFQFQEGIYYEYFNVVPDEGYTFADELTITINGDASLVDNYVLESEYGWITVETIRFYVYDPSHIISSIEVTGFVAPVFGADINYNLYVPEDAHYSIMWNSGSWTSSGFGEGKSIEPDRIFQFQEGIYYEYFNVVPDEGYTFADELTITINGDASLVDNYVLESEYGWIRIETIRFYVYDPSNLLINSVDITGFVAPVFGADINYYLYVPEDAHYSIMWNSGSWTSSGFGEGKSIEPDRAFQFQEGIYYEYFIVVPDEGYAFADELTITINGDASLVDNYVLESEYGWIRVETIRFYVYDPSNFLINSVDITGFTAPEWGAEADVELTVPAECNYSIGDAFWRCAETDAELYAGDVFGEVGTYSMRIEILFSGDYVPADDCVYTINGDASLICSATYIASANKVIIRTVGFTIEDPTIHAIEITGFTPPVYGEEADVSLTVPDGADYSVTEAYWRCSETGLELYEGDSFAAGNYCLRFVVAAEEGRPFADDVTVTINGETYLVRTVSYVPSRNVCIIQTCWYRVTEPTGGNLLGDVNGDGAVGATDAILILRYVLGGMELDADQLVAANVDGNGIIDVTDALFILRYVMNVIDAFPAAG